MRRLLTGYAVWFNRRHQRSGYLFQNRYKSIVCEEDAYLLEFVRYIHLNPIRSLIIKTIEELDHYRWSGHSVLVGKNRGDWQEKEYVLRQFGTGKRRAIRAYRKFMEEGKDLGMRPELVGGGQRRKVSEVRTKIAYYLNREMGISMAEIARNLGVSTSAIAMAIRRDECGK
jgi:putative transposase